jgi:ankyrin repeat protein
MALNINNTTQDPSLDTFKLVKITKDNISDYPGLDAKFIGYDIFVNQIRDIAAEYTRVLGNKDKDGLLDATTGIPSPTKIYEQVRKDIPRAKISINDVQLKNAFESNKSKFNALETSATLEEFRENLAKIFPGISVIDNQPQLEAIYNDKEFKKVIPFIYSIYNRFGITDNEKILQYMAFMQQGSMGSITDLVFPMYLIPPSIYQYVGNLGIGNHPPESEKINMGDFSGKPLDDGYLNISETIEEGKMNAIQISSPLFPRYVGIEGLGDGYIFSALNPIVYISYPANKVYLLMETIWRNESVHKAYDLIKQIDTTAEINQRVMGYIYETIFKDYTSPQTQQTLVNIFDLLLKITDLPKRAEIFSKLEPMMNKILASKSIFIPGKLQYLYSALFDAGSIDTILNAESIARIEAKLKEFDTCDDDIDSSCKVNERLLPNEPTFFNKITQRATDVYKGRITPMSKDQVIEAGNSAIIWAIKAYEWSKKDSIAGAQGAREQIEAIISKLDASAKQYKEDMDRDTSLYKTYNPIYEQIVAISKQANTALNFATAVVIIDTLRQQPEGIGANVKVVNSLVTSTLNDIKKMQGMPEDPVDADSVVGGVEEEKVSDEPEKVAENVDVSNDIGVEKGALAVADEAVEEEKVSDAQPTQVDFVDPMCNNKQKWEEYYKAARPVVEHSIEPDNAWQTEQQSEAKCGHHSLHNLFHNVWTKTECPPKNIAADNRYKEDIEADAEELVQIKSLKEYNDKLIDVLNDYNQNQPIDLYKLCRINRRFQLLDRGSRLQMDDCREEGNYSPVIIRNALNIAGYPTFEINNAYDKKYTTEEYCKFIIDQFQSGNNLIGMILITGKQPNQVGHFIEVRKNNDNEMEVIDTLYKQPQGSQAESETLKLELNGDKDALATQLNGWIGQALYKEIYGVIGVFQFSGKYIPARIDQYFDLTPFNEEYEAKTGHNERYTDETGDIFQKKDTARPNQPNPKTDLIDTCKADNAVDRNFSVETTEVDYVPIYMEDVGVKGGGWRRSKKQRGGANPDIIKVESSAKDLYDIAMMLLNLNGELIEKSESQPSEESDQSNLTNTLTILLNTRIPGKRNLLYKPQMTIPNTNSSQVWFDPRIKLKQSIVNKPQPVPLPVPVPPTQSQRIAQNRYQMPSGYNNSRVQYGGDGDGKTPNERKEIYTQFFNRNEFNNLLLRTMNESPQQIPDLATAKEEGITDNNIQVTLDTLFKSDNVIYIEGAPYTIYAHDWIIGDWQIDTRPNIYVDSSTRFQVQAPTYTSYGVIIPKSSNIAIFEEQAKKERSEIPIALQKGDALEMTSKINKAIKSVLSNVAQNTKPRLTSAEIMKKVSPWELAKLVERQMANRAYEPVRDESPNYVNVEPASVAANARVAEVEKAKAVAAAAAVKKAEIRAAAEAKAADADVKAVTDADVKDVTDADVKAVADADVKAVTDADVKDVADADVKAVADADVKAVADADVKAVADTTADAKTNSDTDADVKAEADAKDILEVMQVLKDITDKLEELMKEENQLKQEIEQVKEVEEQVKLDEDSPVSTETKKIPEGLARYWKNQKDIKQKRLEELLKKQTALAEQKRIAAENVKKLGPRITAMKLRPKTRLYLYLFGESKPAPISTNIDYRLHEQFSNALIASNKMGLWKISRDFIDSNNELTDIATRQINWWKVSENQMPDNTSLQNAIIEICSSIKGFNQTDIEDVFTNNPLSPDEVNLIRCEKICDIKFILIQPFPPPETPPSFTLNQRVNVETTPMLKDLLQGKALQQKSIDAGVIVKEKYKGVPDSITDLSKRDIYNVLTDEFKPISGQACNVSIDDANRKNTCIQYIDGLSIANIPTYRMYDDQNETDMLKMFKTCAFILYDNSNKQNPTYRAIYKGSPIQTARNKMPTYIFELNRLPAYLYYMIFLASYKFNKHTNKDPVGTFERNDESPYPDNAVLNPPEKPIRTKNGKFPRSPVPLNAIYDFYTKRLSGSSIDSLKNEQFPIIMGGSAQSGGGPQDDLVRSIETNNIDDLKSLLKEDASLINKTDATGNTMLMIACQNKNLGIVKTLLEMGAQGTINKQNAIGDTALHIACKNGYAAIASVLVLNGADLTIKNVLGKTPIEVCEDPALKAKLELHKTNVKKMFEFVKNNRTQDLRQLLQTFRGVNLVDLTTGDTPLHIACQLGNKDIALLLIQCGANPALKNNNDQTPFDLVENETLKENLQEQYNLTQMLFNDVENDSLPEIEQILDRLPANQVSILVNSRTNPDSTQQGETPLHIAVKAGNKEMVKFLLDYGADVNAGDKYEATPLHFACRNGDGYIARMLVEFGGDLTIKAIDGRTPLDACKTNELRIDLIKDYIEKLARDNKLNLPKGSGLSRTNDEASIKKALEYYLKKPNKIESKNSYYVVMDLDLYPGTSISTAQKARMQCSRVWDNIQEAWSDSRGVDYVPKEQDISKAPLPIATEVPVAQARPIRSGRTRRRYGGKKGGSTRRCSKHKKCHRANTRKHKHIKHKYNSRRVKK